MKTDFTNAKRTLHSDERIIQENIDTKTRDLVGGLSFDGPAAEDALREWFQLFPESLYRLAAAGLTHRAGQFVNPVLAAERECCRYLCDSELLDAPAAIRLARSLLFLDPRLDQRLARAAIVWATTANQKPLRRCLDILEAMVPRPGINDALVRLLKCVDGAERSRVIDILVRSSADEASIRKWLRDPDPRIRANILESLAATEGEAEWIRQLLLEHLDDPHWRVAANAAVGLSIRGMEDVAVAKLIEMASSGDANVRCSSSWAMGRVLDPNVVGILHQLRKDPDGRVRWNALRSLSRLKRARVERSQAALPAEPTPEYAEELVASE